MRGQGKYEQLMVSGHEIAASTAQLVSASRVKASSTSVAAAALEDASRSGSHDSYQAHHCSFDDNLLCHSHGGHQVSD